MNRGIAYFNNGLGNFVCMMPALQAVASMTSNGKIDICLDDHWRDHRRGAIETICQAWETVDKVFNYPKKFFNPDHYDLWFISNHGSNSSDVVQMFRENGKTVPRISSWRHYGKHETEYYMETARRLGFNGNPQPSVSFPLTPGPVLDLKRPIIGICNGYFRTKSREWDKKGYPHFEALIDVLSRFFGGSMVGVGGKGELPFQGVNFNDFTGKLSILETAKVISQFDLFITTDTGLMHIGNAIGVPMIALFGPTLTSKNAPRGERSFTLQSGMNCAPCQDSTRFYNCHENQCMKRISIGDIVAKAREVLNAA